MVCYFAEIVKYRVYILYSTYSTVPTELPLPDGEKSREYYMHRAVRIYMYYYYDATKPLGS